VQELLVHIERGPVGEPGVLRERLVAEVVGWVCLLAVSFAALLAGLEAALRARLYLGGRETGLYGSGGGLAHTLGARAHQLRRAPAESGLQCLAGIEVVAQHLEGSVHGSGPLPCVCSPASACISVGYTEAQRRARGRSQGRAMNTVVKWPACHRYTFRR
jgi:hypothetical protein